MKCSDARHLIHLSVGDDNLLDDEQMLGEHLHTCSDCRSYNAGMVDAMQVLHDFRDGTVMSSDESVWASVERRIDGRRSLARAAQRPQRQFHGGVVALCACSLVLAFVTVVNKLPVNQGTVDVLDSSMTVMPVNFSPQMTQSRPTVPILIQLVDPVDGKLLGLKNATTNDVFVRAIQSEQLPVKNGLQNF
jgi:predicted anti-sigma-YlaC factor YlaD